ncbi:MAG TPA: FAD-binding oxidoreductase [Anaerolineaceae bacterium]|nr:FAD-binding oxidoreductase [Anaerolineaceae bacterium]
MTPNQNYDVIIIGAGSVGAPAAFYMAKEGLKVMVVDRVPSVGQGSNKKAIGGIRATHSDPAKIRICLRSIEIFSTWKEIYGDEIEWYRGGYCFPAYRTREEEILKNLLAVQKKYGLNIDWLDRQELLDRVPALNEKDLLGGTLSPDDGNASPLLATHAFYTQAQKLGVQFHFNEPVEEILVSQGKVTGILTPLAEYGAGIVVNAAGAYANEVGKMVGLDLPVRPDAHEAAITEAVARFFDPLIVDIRPLPGSTNFYFYQHLTGQIVFCITPDPQIWGTDQRETSNFLPMVARRMVDVMPCLQNIRVRRTWRGLYPMTPDGAPVVGWVNEVAGMMLAVGLCGQGFMLGPGLGEIMARMAGNMLTQSDVEILELLSPYRKFASTEMLK